MKKATMSIDTQSEAMHLQLRRERRHVAGCNGIVCTEGIFDKTTTLSDFDESWHLQRMSFSLDMEQTGVPHVRTQDRCCPHTTSSDVIIP